MKLWKFRDKKPTRLLTHEPAWGREASAEADGRPPAKKGEDLAAEFLKKVGYKILVRNYRNPLGEIDIVAKEEDVIVFVEVKTRRVKKFGLAKEAVHSQKQKKLIRLAQAYLKQHHLTKLRARFDVVAIQLDDNRIEVIKNAFDIPC